MTPTQLALATVTGGLLIWCSVATYAVWASMRHFGTEQKRQGRVVDALHILQLQKVFKKKPKPTDWEDDRLKTQEGGIGNNLTKFDWRKP